MPSWFVRRIVDPFTACLAWGVYRLIDLLPVDFASALGGRLGRAIGPLLPPHRVAVANLALAFPEKTAAERAAIVRGMWDNLGRTFFELPHQTRLVAMGRVEIVGLEHARAIRDDGRPGLLWSGHLGNWELVSAGAGAVGLVMHRIYRAPNNPWMDRLFRRDRDLVTGELLPKGAEGAKRAMKLLRQGEHLGMLVDQKLNDGIAVPFFGREAMTASALATFALVFKAPTVAARVIRLGGARFRIEISPPYLLESSGDRAADERRAMAEVNATLETWIREYPEQWLWVHRRWPKQET